MIGIVPVYVLVVCMGLIDEDITNIKVKNSSALSISEQ